MGGEECLPVILNGCADCCWIYNITVQCGWYDFKCYDAVCDNSKGMKCYMCIIVKICMHTVQ